MNRAAAGLQRRGFRRNTSVVIMMRNRPEFLEVQAGAGRLGAAAVSVSWRSTAAELVYLAQHCGAKAIVFEADLWHVVEQAKKSLPGIAASDFIAVGGDAPGCSRYEDDFLAGRGATVEVDAATVEDAAVVIYTSGTTGKPKGAVRKFPKDAMHASMQFIGETPMRVDDVHLVTCPLYHSTAFGFLAFTALLGGTSVLMDEFKPEAFLQLVDAPRGHDDGGRPDDAPPRDGARSRASSRSTTCARCAAIFTVGAPLPGPLGTQLMDHFGDVLFNFYGATETGLVTMAKPDDLRASPGTIGKALPGNEIRLLDERGHDVPAGEVGELYVRNKMLVAGYHNDSESTHARA